MGEWSPHVFPQLWTPSPGMEGLRRRPVSMAMREQRPLLGLSLISAMFALGACARHVCPHFVADGDAAMATTVFVLGEILE